jgi:hypothetical protein
MGPRPGHRFQALLLALLLALGMSLSFVQGGLMAAGMAVSAKACHHSPPDCDGCGDDGGIDAGTCLSLCGTVAHALVPAAAVEPPVACRPSFHAAGVALGRYSHGPDPGPPRLRALA